MEEEKEITTNISAPKACDSIPEACDAISITITIASLIFAIYSSKKAEKIRKKIDWIEIERASSKIKKEISKEKGTKIFLALDARSGIFAHKIEEKMNELIPIISGFCTPKDKVNREKITQIAGYIKIESSEWCYFIPDTIKLHSEKKIIIFDDFTITGQTFRKVKSELEKLGINKKNLRTSAIACTKTSIKSNEEPDYYWKSMDADEVILPWGKMK